MKTKSIFAVILLVSSIAWSAEDTVLHFTNGGFIPGVLKASEKPAVLRWQSGWFTQPFEFSLNDITGIYFPVPAGQLKPKGEYCLELSSGDVLFGELLGLTGDIVELDSARFGRLHVQRDQISRIYRWNGGTEMIYLGPNGLSGWKESSTNNAWREEGGQLVTTTKGTQIYADFGIPAQAVIEFEVSWKGKPDFVFDLATSDAADEKTHKRPYRIEVWDNELVACCEMAREADVESLQAIPKGAGRVHLLVYLDQLQGAFNVFASDGSRLARVGVTNHKKQVLSGLRFTNKQGDVRLERLRISRWDGALPAEGQANMPRLHRADGAILYGKLTGYDSGTRQFSVHNGTEESKVAALETAGIFLSPPADSTSKVVRAVYQDCTQVSGQLTQVGDDYLQLTRAGIKEALRLPLLELRSFVVLERTQSTSSTAPQGIAGRLEMERLRLPGRLVNGESRADASCLVWHPDQSVTASPLRPGISGRIIFRDPPPPKPSPDRTQVELLMAQNGVRQSTTTRIRTTPIATGPKILHLRSGDTIPCEVSSIDENGITLTTPLSDAKFVSHDKVKAVELVGGQPPKLTKVKRERLLTLPRGQRDSPPTHLIPFKNGDFLRGRLIDMNEKMLHVEVHLETKEVLRDRVAQIIWLHPDEISESETPTAIPGNSSPENATASTRVQAVRSGGNRLTFHAEQLADQTLSGTSDVLGKCRTELQKVDQLLIGSAIESAATNLAYHRWKLHRATEPKVAQDTGDGHPPDGRTPGIDAALVGKPAPDFELDLIGGKKFRLTENKGRVVVLDFWATWCGPCLQAMPQVEQVVREFRDQNVQLIAVNLEEPEKQITSMLQRHKLEMTVAMDRDGVVAAKYEAIAIPQTVVIDHEGKVSRVFVGGGQRLADHLRESLKQLHAETHSSQPAP